jgi:hypothetical protein
MRWCYREHTFADTGTDANFKSSFFFEFPRKTGRRSLIAFDPATGQFPFPSFIPQEKNL